MSTRSKTTNSTFGYPSQFQRSMIPTKADVVRNYLFIQQRQKHMSQGSSTVNDVYKMVTKDLQNMWASFSFPVIQERSITSSVERLIKSALALNKTPKKQRNEKKIDKVLAFNIMFDICSCKCYDKRIDRLHCHCSNKIPMSEWEAYIGQKEKKTN